MLMFVMSCGVMRTYCLRLDVLAVSIYETGCCQHMLDKRPERGEQNEPTIIFILIRRLTASMKTSNSSNYLSAYRS